MSQLTQPAAPLARTFPAIAGIYTVQSLIGGFTFVGLPSVLRTEGVSLGLIGLVSLLMLPWGLKFLWAPVVERIRQPSQRARRTRVVILWCQAAAIAAMAVAALSELNAVFVLAAALTVMALASTCTDIACDAYTIENFPGRLRALGNIAQVGGGYTGFVLGSGLFLVLVAQTGWTVATLALCLVVTLGTLLFLLTPPERAAAPSKETPSERPSLRTALRNSKVRLGLLISILFELGIRLVMPLMSLYLVDKGAPLAWIGVLNGAGGAAAGLFGTLLGGITVARFGAPAAVKTAVTLQTATLLVLAAAAFGDAPLLLVAGLMLLSMVISAFGFVSVYSVTMDLASLKQAGVDFSLFQSAGALTAAVLGVTAAQIAQAAGYPASFALAAAASLLALVTLPLLLNRIRSDECVQET